MNKKMYLFFLFSFLAISNQPVHSTNLEDSSQFYTRKGEMLRSISTIDEVPVGTIMPWPSSGTAIPYSWLPCDGRPINISAFSRIPTQELRDKWLEHAHTVIGTVTPTYNHSTGDPGKGVFLRGKFGAGDYNTEYPDTFRSHQHEQPEHTHPITLNVEDGRANGNFNPQEYTDFYTKRSMNSGLLVDSSNVRGDKALASYMRHLGAVGGVGGLQGVHSIGALSSAFIFPIKKLKAEVEYVNGTGKCTYYNFKEEQKGTTGIGFHPLESGNAVIPTGEIDPTSSKYGWDQNKNKGSATLYDGQSTVTVEGKYKGALDDPTVMGNIHLSGGDPSKPNQNRHDKNNDGIEKLEEETSGEKETAPVNAEVMYIIKIHP